MMDDELLNAALKLYKPNGIKSLLLRWLRADDSDRWKIRSKVIDAATALD